jgi:O-antigen biosynthesis protein
MRLYWLDDVSTGSGHVRVTLPMRELARRGHKCAVGYGQFSIEHGQWDAVVLGRLVMGSINEVLPSLRQQGIKVIYDIDDALELLEPDNLAHAQVMANVGAYFDLLRTADLVTVTTPELAAHARKLVPAATKIAVLPNCVREDEWPLRTAGNTIPRIGFTGSHSRLGDLRWLLEAIGELQAGGLRDKFEFVIFGISTAHDSFEEFHRFCASAPEYASQPGLMATLEAIRGLLARIAHRWERAASIESYPQRLAALNLDLGLCPLRRTDFNRHKSCLKAYEYAMAGTEALCSRATPYADELPGDLFPMVDESAAAWRDAIAGWLRGYSANGAASNAQAQRRWVLEHRTIERNAHLWEAAYSRVLDKSG